MIDTITGQRLAHPTDRIVDRIVVRIASSPQALFNSAKDASAARLRQGAARGAQPLFLHRFGKVLAGIDGL
jgi:hypothetical protein